MALSAYLDKESYEPGDTMTLTVEVEPGERDRDVPVEVRVVIAGLGEVDVAGKVEKPDAEITVTDASHIWTKQSDDGTTAVYTATA